MNLHWRTFLLNCLGVRSIKFGKNLVTDIPRPILHSIRPQPRLLGTVDCLYIISVTYLTVCLSVCHSTWNNIDTQSQVNQLEWPPQNINLANRNYCKLSSETIKRTVLYDFLQPERSFLRSFRHRCHHPELYLCCSVCILAIKESCSILL